jgi:branched-chain amino acid transport system ATP-binding protein
MREISLENIHAAYGNKEVLIGISQRLVHGEIVALLGPNGAGKSTLLKVIAGFLTPKTGRIYFDSREVTNLPPHERVKLGISLFMQGGRVFPNLAVEENLKIATRGLPLSDRRKNLADTLNVFPYLSDLFGKRAGLLSGGERQGLSLAMILIKRPRWLLLDEPSASLSPDLTRQIFLKLKEISVQWNLGILLAEQNIIEATKLAHRILVMSGGRIHLKVDSNNLSKEQLMYIFLGGNYPDL